MIPIKSSPPVAALLCPFTPVVKVPNIHHLVAALNRLSNVPILALDGSSPQPW